MWFWFHVFTFFFNLGEYYDSAMTVNGLDTFQQLVDELKYYFPASSANGYGT